MLIYEKVVDSLDEKKRALYGTLGNLPSKDDEPLVYKKGNGDVISDVSNIKYLYEKNNDVYAGTQTNQVPNATSDFEFGAWLGDVDVLSHNAVFTVTHNAVDNAVVLPKSGTPVTGGTTIRILIAPEEGGSFSESPTLTIGESVELTYNEEDGSFYADVQVNGDMYFEVSVNAAPAMLSMGKRNVAHIEPSKFSVTYAKPRNVVIEPKSGVEFEDGAFVEVTMTPSNGKKFAEIPCAWVNGEPIELLESENGYRFAFVISQDTELTFSTRTTSTVE